MAKPTRVRPSDRNRGRVVVKNVSGEDYTIEEIDHLLADQEQVDLLDLDLSSHYQDWEAANRLVTGLETAKLYQDIQSGDVEIVENTPPQSV
jgi:hypothetical protein